MRRAWIVSSFTTCCSRYLFPSVYPLLLTDTEDFPDGGKQQAQDEGACRHPERQEQERINGVPEHFVEKSAGTCIGEVQDR